jgi:prophage maintenance system killer protein
LTDEKIFYIDYIEAVDLHFALMKLWGETRFGVDSRDLIESALARPKHAAIYENADLVRQAASLVFGLIKNSSVDRWKQTHSEFFDGRIFVSQWG